MSVRIRRQERQTAGEPPLCPRDQSVVNRTRRSLQDGDGCILRKRPPGLNRNTRRSEECLIDIRNASQMSSFTPQIAELEYQVLREGLLNTEVPLLDIGVLEMRI